MASDDLEDQVAAEKKEIDEAPKVPICQYQPQTVGSAGRCYWCGQFSTDLVYVDTVHGVDRYKGRCCGHRHI